MINDNYNTESTKMQFIIIIKIFAMEFRLQFIAKWKEILIVINKLR